MVYLHWKFQPPLSHSTLTSAFAQITKQWSPPATTFVTNISLPSDVDDDPIHGPLATTGLLQLFVSPAPS